VRNERSLSTRLVLLSLVRFKVVFNMLKNASSIKEGVDHEQPREHLYDPLEYLPDDRSLKLMTGEPYVFYEPEGITSDDLNQSEYPKERIERSDPRILSFGFVYPYGAFDNVDDAPSRNHISAQLEDIVGDIYLVGSSAYVRGWTPTKSRCLARSRNDRRYFLRCFVDLCPRYLRHFVFF